MTTIPEYRMAHWVCLDAVALARATPMQRLRYYVLDRRCITHGVTLWSNGVLQVEFERNSGACAEAFIARDGRRIATEEKKWTI